MVSAVGSLFGVFFVVALGLRCSAKASSVTTSRAYSLVAVHGFLLEVASLVVARSL